MKTWSNEGTKEIGGDRMKVQRKKQKPKRRGVGGWSVEGK